MTSLSDNARRVVGIALVLAVRVPGTLSAQAAEPSVAIGVAVPTRGLGAQRTIGPLLRGGLTFGDRQLSHVRLRLELEASWLLGREDRRGARAGNSATFRSVSALTTLLVGATRGRSVAPYGLVGFAVERLSLTGFRSPYGSTVGVRAGAGARWRVRSRTMFVEVAPHLALTDFGTGMEFTPGIRVPIALGVSF